MIFKIFKWIKETGPKLGFFLVAIPGLGACNASQIAQIAAAMQSGGPSAGATLPSSPEGTPPSGCFYRVSFSYDLGPGIDVTEGFEVQGDYWRGISVVERVIESSAQNCPMEVMIPAVGDSRQYSVYQIIRQHDQVSIYSDDDRRPAVFQVGNSENAAGFLVPSGSVGLTSSLPQISNGNETQIFDGGSLTSASGSVDARMDLEVTYDYVAGSTPGMPTSQGFKN